jgi:hypothetical protein
VLFRSGIFFGILRREQGEWELRYKPNKQKTRPWNEAAHVAD